MRRRIWGMSENEFRERFKPIYTISTFNNIDVKHNVFVFTQPLQEIVGHREVDKATDLYMDFVGLVLSPLRRNFNCVWPEMNKGKRSKLKNLTEILVMYKAKLNAINQGVREEILKKYTMDRFGRKKPNTEDIDQNIEEYFNIAHDLINKRAGNPECLTDDLENLNWLTNAPPGARIQDYY